MARAKTVFADARTKPVKVELLYFETPRTYSYITISGETLEISAPSKLVWEVWGRREKSSLSQLPTLEVMGFLDYQSGERVGM